jgi:GTPase SAR1 family protein
MGCTVSIVNYRRLSISRGSGGGGGDAQVCPIDNAAVNAVELELAIAREQEQNRQKILLLGAGEAGKSTVIKQIKMIWKIGGGPTEKEKQEYICAIRANALEAIRVILDAGVTLGVSIRDEEDGTIREYADDVAPALELTPVLAAKIAHLWRHATIQAIFTRRDEYWNMDNTPYYLEEVERIAQSDYEPNEEDMIITRVRTTGIVVTQCPDPPRLYEIVDVGGQRSERKKWLHCFDNVNAIIFLEGLAGYKQVLFEDSATNRMKESLSLFGEIVRNPIFKKTPIFVFLNKKDLFEEMIPNHPLCKCFPDYDGPDGEVTPALEYISNRYKAIMEKHCPGKEVHIQIIAARVRMDMKIAFGEVKDQLKSLEPNKGKAKGRGIKGSRAGTSSVPSGGIFNSALSQFRLPKPSYGRNL